MLLAGVTCLKRVLILKFPNKETPRRGRVEKH